MMQESAVWDGVFSKIPMELAVFRINLGLHERRILGKYSSFCLGWHGILNLHASMSRHLLPYLISREVYNPFDSPF